MQSVTFEDVTKIYDNEVKAVDQVNFEILPGEFLVLVGPSGCGKSTLLRMIAGLEEVTKGKIYFGGKVINDVAPKDRNIGMVFQNYALYPHMTVFDNIAFPLKILKKKKKNIKSKVQEISELIGLENVLDRKPRELSGGQRQRVALGRAVSREPDIFLFDEPLSNLDAKLRVQMRTEIQKIHRESATTSVYVTHDQTEAMTMGTKIVVLKDGKIQQIDPPAKLYSDPDNIFVAGFIGSPQMNFFKGKLVKKRGWIFIENNDEHIFEIPPENLKAENLINEANYTLGIRPEHVDVSHDPGHHEFYVKEKIENIEFLGNETFVYFRTDDDLKCVRASKHIDLEIGEPAYFTFNSSKFLLFDVNGERC